MNRHLVRVAGIVLLAVIAYTAVIFGLVAADYSALGTILMFVVGVGGPGLLLKRRPLLMVVTIVTIFAYTFGVAVSAQLVYGREDDPFGPHCDGNWDDLIVGQECQGPPHGEDGCCDPFPWVVAHRAR